MKKADLIELDEMTEDEDVSVENDFLEYRHTSDYISDIEDYGFLEVVDM